jgi:hypothetical protein
MLLAAGQYDAITSLWVFPAATISWRADVRRPALIRTSKTTVVYGAG